MDYAIFKRLRVKEDDLHINTKSQFCINLINGLNEEISEHHLPNKYLSPNQNSSRNINNNKNKYNQDNLFFANDKKKLDMKSRLKYLLFPEDYEKILEEDLDCTERPKVK